MVVLVGVSEIKCHDLAEPYEIPLVNGLVETVELLGLLDYLLGYLVTFYSLIDRTSQDVVFQGGGGEKIIYLD